MEIFIRSEHSAGLTAVVDEFEDWHVSSYEVAIGSGQIRAYVCQATSLACFAAQWQQINSYIAAKYVAKNKQPFERWNSYLLFVCVENIPKALRYEIENNKFAMRKIVVGDTATVIDDAASAIILNRAILSTEVVLSNSNTAEFIPPKLADVTNDLVASNLQPGRGTAQKNREQWLNRVRKAAKQMAEQQQDNDNEN